MYIRGINSRTIAPLLITSQHYGEHMLYYKKLYYTHNPIGQINRIISPNHIIYTLANRCSTYMTNHYCDYCQYNTTTAVNDYKLLVLQRYKFISVFVIYNIHYDMCIHSCDIRVNYNHKHGDKFDF